MLVCWRLLRWGLPGSGLGFIISRPDLKNRRELVHPPASRYPLRVSAVTAGKWRRGQKIWAVKNATYHPSELNSRCNVGVIAKIISSNSLATFIRWQPIVSGLRVFDLRSVQQWGDVQELESEEDMAAYRLAVNRHLVLWLWVRTSCAQPKLCYPQNQIPLLRFKRPLYRILAH